MGGGLHLASRSLGFGGVGARLLEILGGLPYLGFRAWSFRVWRLQDLTFLIVRDYRVRGRSSLFFLYDQMCM